MPFQHVPQREQLQDVRWGPVGDARTAPGEMFDETLLGQQPQRLPQRRPADAEVGAQLFFDDLVAGPQRRR